MATKLTGRALKIQKEKEKREKLRLGKFSDSYKAQMRSKNFGPIDTEAAAIEAEEFEYGPGGQPSAEMMQQLTGTVPIDKEAAFIEGETQEWDGPQPSAREQLSIYGGDQTGLTTTGATQGAGIASTGAPMPTSEAGYKAATELRKATDKIRNNPTAIQKRLMGDDMTTGFTPERLADLVIKQQEFRANQRKKPTFLKRLRGK
mgnify:CR=1 FL=1